ncbi:MAG: hypothetical protein AB1768_01200 [Pseudomonadota bacterium]|jgi:hypothetical protein
MNRQLRRRLLAVLALILAWPPPPTAAAPREIPRADNLAADASRMRAARIPLLVLYSQADCHWCELVRRDHLLPLLSRPGSGARLLIRQIDSDSDKPLTDFGGSRITHRAFARREGAKVTPTLAVYGPDGRRLAEPLVGVRIADYYGTYIERLIEQAQQNLGQ